MANSFLMLLAATIVLFIIARCMRDAKALAKFMAILAVGLIVGTGIKSAVSSADNTPEKTVVTTAVANPTHSSTSPFVLERVDANLDYVSKDTIASDSVVVEAEGIPTGNRESAFIDDS